MLNVSEQWKNQIYNRPVILVKAEVDLLTGEKLYLDYEDSDDDFMAVGITLQDSTTSDSSFNLGTAVMNVFSFSLNNMDGRYSNTVFSGATITPYFGFKLDSGEVEWVKKGVFNISSNNNKLPKIDFQAYDNMSKLDLPFSAVKITYPITLGNMAKAICDYCGVGLETTAFDNSSYSIKTAPIGTDYSCRKMISCIAQISGGFARFNAEGKLEIKWYSDDIDHEIPVYKDVRAEAKDVTITGIQVSSYYNEDALSEDKPKNTETSLTGVDGFVIAITENPLIPYGSAKTVSTYLGNKLNGTKFRPIELDTFYDPSLEAGDKVKIKDVRNNEYIFFVTNLTANIGGGAHISCVAETVRENTANQYSNSSSAIVKVLDVVNAKIQNLVTSHLDAEIAKIGYLKAEKADIDYLKVGELDAVKAEIEDAIIKNLDAEFATIENLNATNATIEKLQATVAVIDKAYIDEAKVNTLIANKGYFTEAQIENLVAGKGFITTLETENLLAGYATIDLANIKAGSITTAMIGTGVVGKAQIADGSITDAKIVELSANKINAGTLSVERLEIRGSDKSIVYALNNITGALQAQNVDTLNGEILTERTITADKIVANAITANEIAAKTITANEIAAGTITATQLASNSVTASKIKAGAVNTSELAAGAITTEKLAANAVTAEKIDVNDLFAQNITATGTISGATLVGNKISIGENNDTSIIKLCGGVGEIYVTAQDDDTDALYISAPCLGLNANSVCDGYSSGSGFVGVDSTADEDYSQGHVRLEAYCDAPNNWVAQASVDVSATSDGASVGFHFFDSNASYRALLDSRGFSINAPTIFPNNTKIMGTTSGGETRECFNALNGSNQCVIGAGNYSANDANTSVRGKDVLVYSSAAGNANYTPYYRKGNSVSISIETSGFCTNDKKEIWFNIPLSKPIIGNPTVAVSGNLKIRQGNNYTHGSSSSANATPSSIVATKNGENLLRIKATMSATTNATNNDALGIYAVLTITFS